MVKTVKITTDNKISVEELPNWSLGSWERQSEQIAQRP